jgi:hypothetical protein
MSTYLNIVNELAKSYQKEDSMFMTENDVVLHLSRLLYAVIDPGFEIHSELRPWIPENEVIRGQKWDELDQLNWCSKVDLAVTDSRYFQQALEKIKKIQGKKKGLKYWRILLFPLEGFEAVFEVKVRVNSNLDRIFEDINRLRVMHCRHKKCEYYLLVFDKAASEKNLRKIEKKTKKYDYIKYRLVNNTLNLFSK